jgi:hypothetical protein
MSEDEYRTPSMDQQVRAFMALVQELCEGEDTLAEEEAQKAILEVGLEELWKRIIGPDPEDALQFAVQLAQRALWSVHGDVVHVLQMRGAAERARIRKELDSLLAQER